MAMWVIAVCGVAPCQCFSSGGNQTTSPGRISSRGPPDRCAQPQPAVTIKVWPSGCVCHAVRAPGSNVTLAAATRAGSGAWNRGSIRTVPVNQSAGPLVELCEPDLFISIFRTSLFRVQRQPQRHFAVNLSAFRYPLSAILRVDPLLLISIPEFLQVASLSTTCALNSWSGQ